MRAARWEQHACVGTVQCIGGHLSPSFSTWLSKPQIVIMEARQEKARMLRLWRGWMPVGRHEHFRLCVANATRVDTWLSLMDALEHWLQHCGWLWRRWTSGSWVRTSSHSHARLMLWSMGNHTLVNPFVWLRCRWTSGSLMRTSSHSQAHSRPATSSR